MKRFVPREKMSKKQRAALDLKQRQAWRDGTQVKRIESGKQYTRKNPRRYEDEPHSPGILLSKTAWAA